MSLSLSLNDPPSPERTSVMALLRDRADKFGYNCALSWWDGKYWQSMSYEELSHLVRDFSDVLMQVVPSAGERLAILAESGPGWSVVFLGASRAGLITVPLDTKLTMNELMPIVREVKPRVLISSPRHEQMADELCRSAGIAAKLVINQQGTVSQLRQSLGVSEQGEERPGREPLPSDTALIVYTSGTSGTPKGVMLSYNTLLFQVRHLKHVVCAESSDVFLSVLPPHHMLELTCGLLSVLNSGGRICYAPALYPFDVVEVIREQRVSVMVVVPTFLKMLKKHLERGLRCSSASPPSFDHAPSRPLDNRHLPCRDFNQTLGGRLRTFVCGGAPLEKETAQFFQDLGVQVFEGYGLTETGPVITTNSLASWRLGSVGMPLPQVEVKFTTEGELMTRGPHVMQGYFADPELTARVIDDQGWFQTGDLGYMDEDGFLFITGRLKSLIVLPGGKKVSPEEVERAIAHCDGVDTVCVLGTPVRGGLCPGEDEVCAVVVPSKQWLSEHQSRCQGPHHNDTCSSLSEEAMERVSRACTQLAPFKRPSKVIAFLKQLPQTSSCKVRRQILTDWFASEVR